MEHSYMPVKDDGLAYADWSCAFALPVPSGFDPSFPFGGSLMPIAMYRRLIRKVIAQTYAAYCQGQPLDRWWAARQRLERACE